jgi:hypothetical protein
MRVRALASILALMPRPMVSTARRSLVVAAVLVALALSLLVSAAVAAVPTKNGQYSGTLQGGEKELRIHVSPDGTTATGFVYCSGQKSGTFPRFPIVKGAFKVTDKVGGTPVATATGTVISATQLKARLNLSPDSAICDGKGGTIYLKLKTTS